MPAQHGRRRPALSLLEVLVVVAIIGVLLTLLLPAVVRVRETANGVRCRNNLRQLVLACHQFDQDRSWLPPAFGFLPRPDVTSGQAALGTLFYHLLPYIEQENLYRSGRHRSASNSRQNFLLGTANGVHRQPLGVFACPSDPTLPSGGINPATRYAASSYAGNYLVFGVVDANYRSSSPAGIASLTRSFPDGTGNTILFAEKYAVASIPSSDHPQGTASVGGNHWAYFQADCNNPVFAYWYAAGAVANDPNSVGPGKADDWRNSRFQVRPSPKSCNPCVSATAHTAMSVALADGSVRHLGAEIDRNVWWALVTPFGGEPVSR